MAFLKLSRRRLWRKVAGGIRMPWMTEFIGRLDENQAQHLDRETSATGQ